VSARTPGYGERGAPGVGGARAAVALAVVRDVCAALAQQRAASEIVGLLARGGRRLLGADVFAVIDLVKGGRELRVVEAAGPEEADALRGRQLPRSGTLVHRALVEEAPVQVEASAAFPPDALVRALLGEREMRNAVAVPVQQAGIGVGALVAVNVAPGGGAEAVELLSVLADLRAMIAQRQPREAGSGDRPAGREAADEMQGLSRTRWLAALGELAAGVAHDINNALNPIVAFAELIRSRPNDPERVRVFAERILLAARDGAETVRRIQSFTQRRPDTTRRTVVSLTGVVREAVELTRPMLEARTRGGPVNVEVAVGEDLLVHANAIELREALLNLILNAVDAMPDGGTLRIVGRPDGSHVLLAVQDTGSGMTREVLERAPEPFFTTKGPRGTGLGLSQVAGIVRRHNGEMELESWPGVGTTVLLRWPAAPPASEERAAAKAPGILLVDDNPLSLEAVAATLRAGGYTVVTAGSGEEALRLFEPGRYSVLLTDLGLPGLNGWELLDHVRALDPDVRVGVITGTSLDRVGDEVKRRGVELFFTKPVDPERLLAAL
jgi:signal transduction histidine kinase/CheY-like chemotaxis protein